MITADELKKLYELEYKVFQLQLREYLGDTTQMKYMQMIEELKDLLNKAYNEMIKAYDMWFEWHEVPDKKIETFVKKWLFEDKGGEQFIEEEIRREPNITDEEVRKKIDDVYAKIVTIIKNKDYSRIEQILPIKELVDMFTQESKTFNRLVEIYNMLQRNAEAKLGQKMATFHIALTTAHNSGYMALYFLDVPEIKGTGKKIDYINKYLDSLSEGLGLKKWDEDVKRTQSRERFEYLTKISNSL